jgi:hypothetical protein
MSGGGEASPRVGARLRRLKWIATGLALAGLVCGALVLWRTGNLALGFQAGPNLAIGEYRWVWNWTPQLALRGAFGVIGLLVLSGLWPRRLTPARAATRWLALGAALSGGVMLAFMRCNRYPAPDRIQFAVIAAPAFLAAYYLTFRPAGRPALARLGDALDRIPARWSAAALLLMLAPIYWWGCDAIFKGHPIITDSQSQIAQARLMLGGRFTLDISQPLRDVIAFPYAIDSVPTYSQYPAGHILLLMAALGAGLRAQALNWLCGLATVGLTIALARRLEGRAAALAAGLLAGGSPMVLLMSASAMNHATTAAMLALAAWCWMPAPPGRETRPMSRAAALAFLGGLALGWAVITRPLTGLAHAGVWGGAWLIWTIRARRGANEFCPRDLLRRGGAALAGLIPPAAVGMAYNWKTTCHPLQFAYKLSNPELHRLGFHGGALPYAPIDALRNMACDLLAMNGLLFGLIVGAWVVLGAWWMRARLTRHEWVLLALIAAQVAAYRLYQFFDLFLGSRFLYETIPMLALLGAIGIAPTLRRGGMRAGAVGLVLLALTAGGVGSTVTEWSARFSFVAGKHSSLAQFVEELRPLREPTVVVLPSDSTEMIGRWFMGWPGEAPLWFIDRSRYEEARDLPELQGYRWVGFGVDMTEAAPPTGAKPGSPGD